MVKMIVATDLNGGIGINNNIPWKCSEDMKHFKQTTSGNIVIMGRKTFDSIGKPLPNRMNVIISSALMDSGDNLKWYNSIETAINDFKDCGKDIYVIGGSEIYKQTIDLVDEVILSKINGEYVCDKFFDCDLSLFIISKENKITDELTIINYCRKVDVISSVGYSNKEVIGNIMKLYNIDKFDLDCTYSTGSFWKGLPTPTHKTDLYPKDDTIIQADSGSLPFESDSMNNIMFDPPFIIVGTSKYHGDKDGSSIIAKRFEGYANFQELKAHYYRTLKETYRLLKDDGILVLKCQDTVSSGKQHMTHSMTLEMAREVGFQGRDLFILIAKARLNAFNGTKWKQQKHARKYHSYFLVLKKCKEKVNYDFK